MDKITLDRIKTAHPKLRNELRNIYNDICLAVKGKAICRFSYVIRSMEEQEILYAKGRTTPGPVVTWAKPGRSYHNYGMAVDIVLLKDTNGDGTYDKASWETNLDFDGDGKADWSEIVAIFKAYGWTWGGDFLPKNKIDKPHFQRTYGFPTSKLMTLPKDSQGYPII